MWTILRRTFLLWLFMFWQGGFFFYAAVVVAVGTELNGHFEQGLMTREVTVWLNFAGAASLAAWALDLTIERTAVLKIRWALWIFMLAAMVALYLIHPQLDALINHEEHRLVSSAAFRPLHRWYLWINTAQWAASIAFTFFTLVNWRAADRAAAASAGGAT